MIVIVVSFVCLECFAENVCNFIAVDFRLWGCCCEFAFGCLICMILTLVIWVLVMICRSFVGFSLCFCSECWVWCFEFGVCVCFWLCFDLRVVLSCLFVLDLYDCLSD